MNTYLKNEAQTRLVLDARPALTEKPTQLQLRVRDPENPNTWHLLHRNLQLDTIETILQQPVALTVEIQSDSKKLMFAPPKMSSYRQIFSGIMFITGNRVVERLGAFSSKITQNGILNMQVKPSVFWRSYPRNHKECQNYDGNKIGFRFVLCDQQNKCYFSHDPILVGRDWDEV